MVISKENLTDLKEKYEKALKLIEEESKNDPPSDPYRSHYAAREVLIKMADNLKNLIQNEMQEDELLTYKVILAFVYRDLGKLNVFVEEPHIGEKYFEDCVELIGKYKHRFEAVIPYLGVLNELGILWSNRQDAKKSKEFLMQAQKVYNDFKSNSETSPPLTLMDLFGTRDEIEPGKGVQELEKLYTLTVFYIAQILGQLGETDLSAKYCNETLRRQLEANDYDPIDWALNAATLSQYFLEQKRFTEGRHHLAAATYIISEYETKIITADMSEEAQAAAKDNFNYRFASIGRCWTKYGLSLLSASIDRLMTNDSKDEDELDNGIKNISLEANNSHSSNEQLLFPTLKSIVSSIENRVTDQYCLTFDDAKLLFQFVTMWLEKSKEYFKPETEVTEYSKIVMDYSDLYKHLAFFEDQPANQSKLHKKRANYIEDLLKMLNRRYYLSICRECWYELALIYGTLLNIKLDALSELKFDESPSPHALHKINTLCDKAIKHLKELIDSYKNENGDLQKNLSNEELQVILQSYFHLGRFFYKIITPNKTMQLSNLQNSLKFYSTFVKECTKYNEAAQPFKAEIGVSKEMVSLLPLKIEKVAKEIEEED